VNRRLFDLSFQKSPRTQLPCAMTADTSALYRSMTGLMAAFTSASDGLDRDVIGRIMHACVARRPLFDSGVSVSSNCCSPPSHRALLEPLCPSDVSARSGAVLWRELRRYHLESLLLPRLVFHRQRHAGGRVANDC